MPAEFQTTSGRVDPPGAKSPPAPRSLPDLNEMGSRLTRSSARFSRLVSGLPSHLDELTAAVTREDWVYAHRLASALARLSAASGDAETHSAAEAVCLAIERSGEQERIRSAVRRLCRPAAARVDAHDSG